MNSTLRLSVDTANARRAFVWYVYLQSSKWIEQCLSKSSSGENGSKQIVFWPPMQLRRIFWPLVSRLYYALKLRVMCWSRDLGLDLAIFTLHPGTRVGEFERDGNSPFFPFNSIVSRAANLDRWDPLESLATKLSFEEFPALRNRSIIMNLIMRRKFGVFF